jgi:hypothetical protein
VLTTARIKEKVSTTCRGNFIQRRRIKLLGRPNGLSQWHFREGSSISEKPISESNQIANNWPVGSSVSLPETGF